MGIPTLLAVDARGSESAVELKSDKLKRTVGVRETSWAARCQLGMDQEKKNISAVIQWTGSNLCNQFPS